MSTTRISRKANGKSAAKAAKGKTKAPAARRKRKVMTPELIAVLQTFTRPELARILGISRQSLHAWSYVRPQYALAIEAASKGKLTKEFLAPDYYPPKAKGGAHVRR